MATSGLYGSTAASSVALPSGSESSGLYGNNTIFGGTYFEWLIFKDSATQPAIPTGGSWDFSTNVGTPPSGWTNNPASSIVDILWLSIGLVNSRSNTITWSFPGIVASGSGLPILTGSGTPTGGADNQLYIDISTTPETIWFKLSGVWTKLNGTSYQLNLAGDGAVAPGKLQWDTTWGGPQIGMAGGNVNLQIGQESLIYVYNNTGTAFTDGQIVYVTGSQGQRLTVGLAKADAEVTSASVIGMVTEPIANNASGFVTVRGMVNGISTTGIADGTILYLSPTTAGAWTSTKPQAPQHLVTIGYVVKGNSGGGSVYISTQSGYELDELHDVKITSVANNNLLQYDNTIPAWKNVSALNNVAIGSITPAAGSFTTLSASGNLLVGVTSGTKHMLWKSVAMTEEILHVGRTGTTPCVGVNGSDGTGGWGASPSVLYVGKNSTTSRSVSAGGTINASGADYAEYEHNNGLTIAKGDIVGFKADGTLTRTFADAVRFGIKSTNPSYIGGDTWGTEAKVGKRPDQPVRVPDKTETTGEGDGAVTTVIEPGDTDSEWEAKQAKYAADLAAFEARLEAARLMVDRIAYSGKVPVNVTGATPGDYIVAVAAKDGSITGEAVANPTFDQYRNAVGRVNRILEDGRCEVAVMVH